MIVIDTHVLIWWANDPTSLSAPASEKIEDTLSKGDTVIVSCISAWEIAMLVNKGRLILNIDVNDWLNKAHQIEGIIFQPIDIDISIKSTMLPGDFHNDPADRMIIATARKFAVPLVTKDEKIIDYKHVTTIW